MSLVLRKEEQNLPVDKMLQLFLPNTPVMVKVQGVQVHRKGAKLFLVLHTQMDELDNIRNKLDLPQREEIQVPHITLGEM